MTPQFNAYSNHVQEIINAVLAAADPAAAVQRHLQCDGRYLTVGSEIYTMSKGQIYLISVGKAAVTMGLAAANILGNKLAHAIFVAKKTDRDWTAEIEASPLSLQSSTFSLFQSGHPVPDEESVRAGAAVLDLLHQTNEDDLVIFLISGGASALLARPLLPLADWQALTNALLASGCTIAELNTVRRQLDAVKGGGLARAAAPATCASLILSDVVGSPLEAIGSGPTVISDESPADALADALAVLHRYRLHETLETAVWQNLTQQLETNPPGSQPKPADNQHDIIADVGQAAHAALTKAAQLGFISQILTTHLEGEAREAGRFAAALAKDNPPGRCLILGGETTVTLHGQGRGGRNQELALAAAIALEGWPGQVVVSLATDGEDGPTDAAGAMVTGETAVIARRHHLNPITFLQNNDSYRFFRELDTAVSENRPPHHIKIGATGTNVNDLIIILTYPVALK
jgi:hydroxypyruvate reductase